MDIVVLAFQVIGIVIILVTVIKMIIRFKKNEELERGYTLMLVIGLMVFAMSSYVSMNRNGSDEPNSESIEEVVDRTSNSN